MVDPIGPIKMKSRTEWLLGEQAAPNFRGVQRASHRRLPSTVAIEDLLTNGADGIDVLYICDAQFSERAKDPRSSPTSARRSSSSCTRGMRTIR